ncbi:unnamed protein product [Rhizophagus irregularis]|nr:unnamed protein product [Rhizophagus irregularis]
MEMDTLLPKELIPEGLPELAINIPIMDQYDQTCLEDMETNAFLNKVYKKKVSNEIKQRNQKRQTEKKKLYTESVTSSGQKVAKQSCQNSHKKKGVEKIVNRQEPISSDSFSHETEISATARHPKCSSSFLLDLVHLFDKVYRILH